MYFDHFYRHCEIFLFDLLKETKFSNIWYVPGYMSVQNEFWFKTLSFSIFAPQISAHSSNG